MSDAQAVAPGTDAPELASLPAWRSLVAHHAEVGSLHLRELFARDADLEQRLPRRDDARRPAGEQYLKRLPACLQQLTMQSNGKHVRHSSTHALIRRYRRLRDQPSNA